MDITSWNFFNIFLLIFLLFFFLLLSFHPLTTTLLLFFASTFFWDILQIPQSNKINNMKQYKNIFKKGKEKLLQIYLRQGATQRSLISDSSFLLHRSNFLSNLFTLFKIVHYHGWFRTLVVTYAILRVLINTASFLITEREFLMIMKKMRRKRSVYIGEVCRVNKKGLLVLVWKSCHMSYQDMRGLLKMIEGKANTGFCFWCWWWWYSKAAGISVGLSSKSWSVT